LGGAASIHALDGSKEVMNQNRRNFVQKVFSAALSAPFAAFAAGKLAYFANRQQSAVQSPQSPHAAPPPFPSPPANPFPDTPKIDPKLVLKHNQQQIQDDIIKLYDLAGELKEQVGKTDSANVLSLPLVQKAEEIEKLAKQIKNLARGS
jgi:hypothetical protein